MLPEKHTTLLDRWVKSLKQVPAVDVIWLDGSLTDDKRANPGSDIDIRFGLADSSYDQLWKEDPTPLLEGLGDYLSLARHWRLLTAEGLIVEIMAFKTSELEGKEFYEWEFLFCRLPDGEPKFTKLAKRSAGETWPHPEELTPEKIKELTNLFLHWLAGTAIPFYADEIYSARFSLELLRAELIKLLFRRAGVSFFKRYKHLSEVLPKQFISDLEYTHDTSGRSPLGLAAIAAETLATFEMAGKSLEALSEKAGGGFEAKWYNRLFRQLESQLEPFMKD